MADPLTLSLAQSAVSASAGKLAEATNTLAQNPQFAESFGRSIENISAGGTITATTVAKAIAEMAQENNKVRLMLIERVGSEFVLEALKEPDVFAKKYSRAATTFGETGVKLAKYLRTGQKVLTDLPSQTAEGVVKTTETIATAPRRALSALFTGRPRAATVGGMGELLSFHGAVLILAIIFIVVLIYWTLSGEHKKRTYGSPADRLIVFSGSAILVLSLIKFFAL